MRNGHLMNGQLSNQVAAQRSKDVHDVIGLDLCKRIRRQSPDTRKIADAAALLAIAKRPMSIAAGGVEYSGAVAELTAFAESTGIPVVETIAGRANLAHDHGLNIGPIGVRDSD